MTFSFNKKYFTDQQIINYVNDPKMHSTILSVVNHDGFHLLFPVWTIFYKDKFYFSTDDYSQKFKIISKPGTKIGLSIMEAKSYPNGRPGVIPYFSTSGIARIRRKEDFSEYEKIIYALYDKFDKGFPNREAKQKWINLILHETKSRVLIELNPEKTIVYEQIEKYMQNQNKKN